MSTPTSKMEFRQAMRTLVSTVTVISAAGNNRRQAMTATSVGSLSLDPPAIYVSVNQATGLHDLLVQGFPFCLNVLSAEQQAVADACSRPPTGDQRFKIDRWSLRDGTPYLTSAACNIFCELGPSMDYATHTLFVGQVSAVVVNERSGVLLYGGGQYLTGSAVNRLI